MRGKFLCFFYAITFKQLYCSYTVSLLLRHFYKNILRARNFGHARAVNLQTWENLKNMAIQNYKTLIGISQQYGRTSKLSQKCRNVLSDSVCRRKT